MNRAGKQVAQQSLVVELRELDTTPRTVVDHEESERRVEELQLHNEYQLRLKDMSYSEKIKEVTEKYMQDLEQDKNKYELLREEKNDMEMEYEERLKQMDDKHQHELQELENSKELE